MALIGAPTKYYILVAHPFVRLLSHFLFSSLYAFHSVGMTLKPLYIDEAPCQNQTLNLKRFYINVSVWG